MNIKIYKIVFGAALAGLAIFGAWYVKFRWDRSLAQTSDHALIIARTAADALNGEMLKQLRASADDIGTVPYESVKKRLVNLPQVDKNVRFAYIYVRKGGQIYFLADSELADSPDYSPPGQIYEEADKQYFLPFENGWDLVTKPVSDRWGEWISVLVPMPDAQTGQIRAVFAIDYPAAYWQREAIYAAGQALATSLLLLLLLGAMFLVIKKTGENEVNFRSLFETIDDIILISDKKGNILYANNAAWRKLGYTHEEFESMRTLDLRQKSRRREAEEIFAEVLAGKTDTCLLPLEKKDGALLPSETRVWFGEWNGKESVFCISKDLSVQEAALQKLKLEKTKVEKLAAIVENANEAIIGKDLNGIITEWNRGAQNLYGFSAAEMIGKPIKGIVPPEKYSEVDDLLKKIGQGAKIDHFQTMRLKRDGSKIDVSISMAPIKDQNGKIAGVSAIAMDITKEKQIDRAKTEFVSLASHQLRTPLTSINWYLEMLLAGDAGKTTKKQKEFLEQIFTANKRMADLVNSLLNVSRIDTGTFAIEPEPSEIAPIIDDVLLELAPSISAKKMEIEKTYDPDLGKINVDPRLTRVIFQNLLSNAVKYTPEKGKIAVETRRGQEEIKIKVADNGQGIPHENQAKVFEKLYRADNARQSDTEGTGLGLYIVKSILDEAGGKVWFESEINRGATFYISLPLSGMKPKAGTRGLQ